MRVGGRDHHVEWDGQPCLDVRLPGQVEDGGATTEQRREVVHRAGFGLRRTLARRRRSSSWLPGGRRWHGLAAPVTYVLGPNRAVQSLVTTGPVPSAAATAATGTGGDGDHPDPPGRCVVSAVTAQASTTFPCPVWDDRSTAPRPLRPALDAVVPTCATTRSFPFARAGTRGAGSPHAGRDPRTALLPEWAGLPLNGCSEMSTTG